MHKYIHIHTGNPDIVNAGLTAPAPSRCGAVASPQRRED